MSNMGPFVKYVTL